MKMLMMIFKKSLEEDIKAVLAAQQVSAFTEMQEITGVDKGAATLNSLQWPGFNNMVLAAMPEQQADRVIAALTKFREDIARKQGNAKVPFRVFALPCEMVV